MINWLIRVSRGMSIDRFYILSTPWFGIKMHRIHSSDPPGVYHNHPWPAISLHWRAYNELFPNNKGPYLRKMLNYLPAKRHHRVMLLDDKPVWTLLIHGKRCNRWSTCDEDGKIMAVEPWRGVGKETHDYTKVDDVPPDVGTP